MGFLVAPRPSGCGHGRRGNAVTSIRYGAVSATDPIDGYTPTEARINSKGESGQMDVQLFAIAADCGSDGVMILGTPVELREWLVRAGRQLDESEKRWPGQQKQMQECGTGVDCEFCGAMAGEPCDGPHCGGRLNPSGASGVEDEDLAAMLRFEDDAEERGRLSADERDTCHSCKAWATDDHLASAQHTQG